MTQAQLADASGIAQPHISAYEGGKRTVAADVAAKVDAATRAAEAVIGDIGDTASHLPARFRDEFDGQPWTLIVGIRITVAHKYHDLDYHQVWTALVGARALRLYVEDDILRR